MAKAEDLPLELQDEIFGLVASSDLHSVPNLALVDKRVNDRLLSDFYSTVEVTSWAQSSKFIKYSRPKVTTLAILSIRAHRLAWKIPEICPNIRKLALYEIPPSTDEAFWDSFSKLQLQVFSIRFAYHFGMAMDPNNGGQPPILESLTHLNCERITPWGHTEIACNISPSSFPNLTHVMLSTENIYDIAPEDDIELTLAVGTWLKLPGLKSLIIRFSRDTDMNQYRSSALGAAQIADPRVVCLRQIPYRCPLSGKAHFEFLNRMWALGEEEHSRNV
ncbi:hypothetical protein BDP27DRAFT_1349038, partial [Rhodocollybia butyracea]